MILVHLLVLQTVWPQILAGRPDFSIFYTAGLILKRGQGHELYNNALQWRTQREFASVRVAEGPLPYNHPPFEAILYVPLAFLSYLLAYKLWAALNVLLLAGILIFLRPNIRHSFAAYPWLPFLATFGFYPMAAGLMQGQDAILLLAVYSLTYAALRRGKDAQAGMWLGLGLFKFHFVLPFVFILLLLRRLRAVSGFLLSGVAVAAASLELVGWRELLYYPRYVWDINRHPPMPVIRPEDMPNLRGLFTGWTWSSHLAPWPEIGLVVVSLALLAWAARQWDPANLSDLTSWNNGFSIALVVTFLVSYHAYTPDMSFLFLPCLLVMEYMMEGCVRRWYGVVLWLCLGALFFSPLYLVLTLHYSQQHMFALVLLAFVLGLAKWTGSLKTGPPTHDAKIA